MPSRPAEPSATSLDWTPRGPRVPGDEPVPDASARDGEPAGPSGAERPPGRGLPPGRAPSAPRGLPPGKDDDGLWSVVGAVGEPPGAEPARDDASGGPEDARADSAAWVRRGALGTAPREPVEVREPEPVRLRKPPVRRPETDPGRRAALVDDFVGEFVGSATWAATLAVLEGAFPGSGMAVTLSRRADELWGAMVGLDRRAELGVPAWVDHAGMVLDLSAHAERSVPDVRRGRASRPYPGAFVIDTLDPLRYHRPVGGPVAPGAGTLAAPRAEDEDSGVVIVGSLAASGTRVLDSAELWRYAGRVVAGTLHEPGRADTRARARRALRALRRAVVVDPELRLALCLGVDEARVPRCMLALTVRDETPRFVRA
ncbi:hypothetical protein [Actinomadura sediminis]|uniref:GAF domain-containing protein n=1 Tax=Actinomadura sediminis TaxID=1038904 RepID=A0ABW3F1I3_9ACTN